MSHTRLRPHYTFDDDRLAQLKAVIPEAFADGRINWETLQEILDDHLEDESVEHYGLSWPGKREARKLASQPSRGTLIPCPGEGVNEDSTRNIFIEGENLEVLKIILKSYAGRVKTIFIDPPYNTGNDFIYRDDFSEPLEAYLRRSGQADEDGLLTSNPTATGRFHSNWLSMMLPRLLIARKLLSESGFIFISVDDNEFHNLRMLLDEIFGMENFMAVFAWQAKDTPGNDSKGVATTHNYVICYKSSDLAELKLLPRTEKQLANYKNPDNDPRGPWLGTPLTRAEYRERDYYALENPVGEEIYPPEGNSWRRPREVIADLERDNRVYWGLDGTSHFPFIKQFLSEVKEGVVATTWWDYKFAGSTRRARKEMKDLFQGERGFDTPKPLDLISRVLQLTIDQQDIVLDFFCGSATTAHAVLRHNYETGDDANFIMVQIPELVENSIYPTISDFSKERIRRAINSISSEESKSNEHDLDLGFRVYRLERSSFGNWQDVEGSELETLQSTFDAFQSSLVHNWLPSNLLVEILLLEGFPLDCTITNKEIANRNDVHLVDSDFHTHRLWVCLDERIAPETIESLELADNDVFVCLDNALSDEDKIRLSDVGNLKTI